MAKLRVHCDAVGRICRHGVLGTNRRPVGGRLHDVGRRRGGDGSERVGERRPAASGLGGATNILLVLALGRRTATAAAENNDEENDAAGNGGNAPIPPKQTRRSGNGGVFANSARHARSDNARVSSNGPVDPDPVLAGRNIDAVSSGSSANGLSGDRVSLRAGGHQSSQNPGAAHLISQRASRVALTRVGAALAGNGAGAQIERRNRSGGKSSLADCRGNILLANIEQHAAGIGGGRGGGARGAESGDDVASSRSFGRAVGGNGNRDDRGREHKGLRDENGRNVDSSAAGIAGIHPETRADAALLAGAPIVAETEKKGARRIVGAVRVKGAVAGGENESGRDEHAATKNVAVDGQTNLPHNVRITPGNGNLSEKGE